MATSAFSSSALAAAALPRTRVEVGMVRAEPEAAVRTRPPAVVKSHHIKEVVNVTFWQWGGERLILHWGW